MSKLSSYATKEKAEHNKYEGQRVENFMGGDSYLLTPLATLKMVACSSIFGEPSYYRPSKISGKGSYLKESIFGSLYEEAESTEDVFTKAIDASLDYDFKGTLEFAKELRQEYYMRLNPAVIFVRASVHSKRAEFNVEYKDYMKQIGLGLINRPDDITNQFEYYMFLKGTKNNLPSLLKRTWAKSLSGTSRYQLNKYKSKSLIDICRIAHPQSVKYSKDIDELLKTGELVMPEGDKTWEQLRSEKKTWKEIMGILKMPHMALLRNLRGIFSEVKDLEFAKETLQQLKNGVKTGKQFPYRYYSALKAIESADVNHKGLIMDTLEECMDIAVENFPKLKGKTICLSDNSGSAHGSFSSEYGSVTVSDIANLSSIMTSMNSDEGEVGIFGDELAVMPTSKRNGMLSQLKEANRKGDNIGQATENGIWIFFRDAIKEKKVYDNIFIYSDMQAGHGGLYGTATGKREYQEYSLSGYVDVLKLVQEYRKKVNPKVNLFSVQVAGYDNSVLPENYYRTAILEGWTGKEALYAEKYIKTWNSVDGSN